MKAIYTIYVLGSIALFFGFTHMGALCFGIGSMAGLLSQYAWWHMSPAQYKRRTFTVPKGIGEWPKSLSERIDEGMHE